MLAIIPRTSISIRPAAAGDLAFIDRLQQMHSKAVGFMPKAQLQQKIARGEVVVAEDEMRLPIGYCIASDRYFKRDEVGIVYQMNVSPGAQRKLVAASMLKAVFERAPYGCKLFCCWCAQDLEANYFWESMGFVPLAFRTGAHGKKGTRTHVFWQKRIREGDATTPYWYPCKTDGGSMREDRLVLPIPPGVHWADAMPILIPQVQTALPGPNELLTARAAKRQKTTPALMPPTRKHVQFGSAPPARPPVVAKAKSEKPKREKIKANPKHIAAARELRDRYLEQFNAGAVLPGGKYEVTRRIEAPAKANPLLIEQASPQAEAA